MFASQGEFKWAPEHTKLAWTSLKTIDWSDFQEEFDVAFEGLSEPVLERLFRGSTEVLSMSVTIPVGA